MLQAQLLEYEKIIYKQVPRPVPANNEVLIKIKRVGICGSDIHTYHGKHPFVSCPIVLGHEFSGEVEEIGKDVMAFKAGDWVTVIPQIYCGECYSCKKGRSNICEKLNVIGCLSNGASQEFLAIRADKVYKLPKSMSFDEGAMIEPAVVGLYAVKKAGDLKGRNILILGAGTIGNLLAQCAKAKGAAKVVITDVSDFRLELAKKCNIEYTVNVSKEDLGAYIRERFDMEYVDYIFECAGREESLEQAITLARKGTDIILVAVYENKAAISVSYIQDRELRLIGTLMYKEADFIETMELIEDGSIDVKSLISVHFPLQKCDMAYHYIKELRDRCMKVIIDVS